MIKIIKFAKKSWYIMIMIILMLVVQAYAELSLPAYTADIVDVGIQYGGIESPVADVMREDTYNNLMLFVDEQDRDKVNDSYELINKDTLNEDDYDEYKSKYPAIKEGSVYILKDSVLEGSQEEQDKKIDELGKILVPAETIMISMTSDETQAVENREKMLSSMGMDPSSVEDIFSVIKMLPQEAIDKMKESMNEQMGDMSELMGDSVGIQFVQDEYESIGIDLGDYQMDYLKAAGLKMLGLALIGMMAAVIVGFLASRLAASTGRNVRNQVFKKVVSFSNAEMNNFSTASLITRCTNDIQQIQMVMVMLFRMVAYAPIMGIGGIIKVINSNTYMAWIIAVAVVAIICLVGVLMAVAMPKFKMMQTLVDRLNLVTREILTGLSVIRAFGREKEEEKRFDGASKNLMKTQLFTNRSMALMMPTMMFIMNAITVLIIWVGANGVDLGEIQVGDMMAFITYTMQIVMSFLMITMVSVMLPRASVAADRINEVLNSKTLILDGDKELERNRQNLSGEVEFDHVSFKYPGAMENVLEDLTFTAKPGETTAIIGSTGCGKSTLIQLIPRLYDATEGKVMIDGNDVKDLKLHELREMIGFVPQKGVLFSGTIESNIKFGVPDADIEQVKDAADIAQAAEFINSKPEGYNTPVAQGGGNVSGGQKQRLSIARAIAKNSDIYIFDDSFSALDYNTDAALRKELSKKVSDATVIIVAQRISTIINADKILVLDDGKIVGEGTHKQLLKESEVYQQIASSQFSQAELGREA